MPKREAPPPRASDPALAPGEGSGLRAWLDGAPLSRSSSLLLGLVGPMLFLIGNAWRVRGYTVDDAYISFRYAENFSRGLGLVYNPGERVEGYTNFLWTLLLGAFAFLGAPPPLAAKILGLLCACAALVPTYLLSERLRSFTRLPCLATWLLASSFLFSGYSVFGLETPLFLLLVLGGTRRFFLETDEPKRLPWSGLVFGLAALTRPEAPLFLGLLTLWQGRGMFRRQSLVRGAIFVAIVALHLLFRKSYYGEWLPNTLTAKTGDVNAQLAGGLRYVGNYASHAGIAVGLGLGSIVLAVVRRRTETLALASIAVAFGGYVVLVGGDWMPFYRFLAPAEPFAFLLADDALRTLSGRPRRKLALLGVTAALLLFVGAQRGQSLAVAQRGILRNDKAFWDDAAGRTASWLVDNGGHGPIAIADIGEVGYRTGFPVVDMLGLLTPEIARLPGGYTRKVGPGYGDALYGKNPRYVLVIAKDKQCKEPTVPSSRAAYRDPRFTRDYTLRHPLELRGGAAWCIFEKKTWP